MPNLRYYKKKKTKKKSKKTKTKKPSCIASMYLNGFVGSQSEYSLCVCYVPDAMPNLALRFTVVHSNVQLSAASGQFNFNNLTRQNQTPEVRA